VLGVRDDAAEFEGIEVTAMTAITWWLLFCSPVGCASVPMQSLQACQVAVEQTRYPREAFCVNTVTGERAGRR
jgi:hypothetical protein